MTWPNDTGADFAYWDEKILWRIDEAAALLQGLDPRIFETESIDRSTRKGPKSAIHDFPKCRRAIADLVRLARANDIKHIEDIDNPDMPMFWCVFPEEIRSRFPRNTPDKVQFIANFDNTKTEAQNTNVQPLENMNGISGATFDRLKRAVAAFPSWNLKHKGSPLLKQIRDWLKDAEIVKNDREAEVFGSIIAENFKLSTDNKRCKQ